MPNEAKLRNHKTFAREQKKKSAHYVTNVILNELQLSHVINHLNPFLTILPTVASDEVGAI